MTYRWSALLMALGSLSFARAARADATGVMEGMGSVGREIGDWGMLTFTIGPSFTDFQTTNAFDGLPGAPANVSQRAWSVGVLYASSGPRWAFFAANRLQFGQESDQGDGVSLHRTFGLEVPFAVGYDLAHLLGSSDFTFAPAAYLMARVGPKYELTIADGSTMSFASVSVPLAPGAIVAVKPSVWIAAGYAPHPAFLFAHVTGTEGTGSLARYRPPQAPPTSQTYSIDVNGLRPQTMLYGTAAFVLGGFVIRADFHRTKFEFSDSNPGWNGGFVEQEVHVSIGGGAGGELKFLKSD